MEGRVFPVWASSKVHDFEFFGLDAQTDVRESLLKNGKGVLKSICVDGKRRGRGEKNAIVNVGQGRDTT